MSRLRQAVSGLTGAARGRNDLSLVELIQTPAQREILDRLTGLMSLLEGHADVVMDIVGPSVVPSVATGSGSASTSAAATPGRCSGSCAGCSASR